MKHEVADLIRAILAEEDDMFFTLPRRAAKCASEIWSDLQPSLQARIRNGMWRVWADWSNEEHKRKLNIQFFVAGHRLCERSDAWHERLRKDFSLCDGAFHCLTQVDQLTRRRLIDLLRNTNGDEGMLASKSYVRQGAARLLGLIRARDAIPMLVQQLRNIDPDAEAAVAQALGEMQATEAIPSLLRCLNDSSGYWEPCRKAAALAILKIVESEPTQMIEQIFPHLVGDAGLRRVVAETVRDSPMRRRLASAYIEVLEKLKLCLEGFDYWCMKTSSIDILCAIGDEYAVQKLTEWLPDSDPVLRGQIVEALEQISALNRSHS